MKKTVWVDHYYWNFGPPDQNFRRTKISVTGQPHKVNEEEEVHSPKDTNMRLCMWAAREILWAVFDTSWYLHVSVIFGTWLWALSVELECSAGVRELTSTIFYARCLLLGYVRSALCLLMLRKPCGYACIFIRYACIIMNKSTTANV